MISAVITAIVVAGLCFYLYRKVNRVIGDDPMDLSDEEKTNAEINNNKKIEGG